MKLFVIALIVASVPAFGQDPAPTARNVCFIVPASETSNFHVAGCTPEREAQIRQAIKIKTAIAFHHAFVLPDTILGPGVNVTASALSDDGHALTLSGVEIVSDGFVVRADQLVYDWSSRRIEARGNVLLMPPQ